MTKSTFLGVFRKNKEKKGVEARIKEVTYSKNKGEEGKIVSSTDYTLLI